MARLRADDGCPWDREQTLEDVVRYVLEEARELQDAVGHDDPEAIEEELGDVLFNLLHAARIGEEKGLFDIRSVVERARRKIVRRHPHVFGDAKASTPEEVLAYWERVKAEEKEERKGRED